MKKTRNIFFTLLFTVVSVSSVMAGEPLPIPNTNEDDPPAPPGPIDQDLVFLFVSALMLGTYSIYKYNTKRKASM